MWLIVRMWVTLEKNGAEESEVNQKGRAMLHGLFSKAPLMVYNFPEDMGNLRAMTVQSCDYGNKYCLLFNSS